MMVMACVCWSSSAVLTLACWSDVRLSCCASTATWSSIVGGCPGWAELGGCWLCAPGCWPGCIAPGFCEGCVCEGWPGCMPPCGCWGWVDGLPDGYCDANAPAASETMHKKITALILFIVWWSPSRYGGQSLCDAGFAREEGRAALDQRKKRPDREAQLPVLFRGEQLRAGTKVGSQGRRLAVEEEEKRASEHWHALL